MEEAHAKEWREEGVHKTRVPRQVPRPGRHPGREAPLEPSITLDHCHEHQEHHEKHPMAPIQRVGERVDGHRAQPVGSAADEKGHAGDAPHRSRRSHKLHNDWLLLR